MPQEAAWALDVDHPAALTDAIGRVAIKSAMLETYLEQAVGVLSLGYIEVNVSKLGDQRLGRLLEQLSDVMSAREFPEPAPDVVAAWPQLRQRLGQLAADRDHIIHSVWQLDPDGTMHAQRRHKQPKQRHRAMSLNKVRRTAAELSNACFDVFRLATNVKAQELGFQAIPPRDGDVH